MCVSVCLHLFCSLFDTRFPVAQSDFNSRSFCSHFLRAEHNHVRLLHAGDRAQGFLCSRPRLCQMSYIPSYITVSIAVVKDQGQRQLGEEGVYFSLQLSDPITEGNQGRNSGQEPGHRNWSRGHGGTLVSNLLLMTSSASFLLCLSPSPYLIPYHNAKMCYSLINLLTWSNIIF